MAEIYVEGTNLGYTEKPYDFTNDNGEQIKGVSQLLHVLVDTDVLVVKVPDAMVPQARALAVKEAVGLRVTLPKGTRPTLADVAAA